MAPAALGETSIKVRGQWAYLSRPLDKFGNTIDFYLSATRNTKAAERTNVRPLNLYPAKIRA